jgi:fucose 4-O-acetylase-like acetyltransferase
MKKKYVFFKSEKQNICVNKKMYFLLKPYIFYFLFQIVIVFLVVVFYLINYDANKKKFLLLKTIT